MQSRVCQIPENERMWPCTKHQHVVEPSTMLLGGQCKVRGTVTHLSARSVTVWLLKEEAEQQRMAVSVISACLTQAALWHSSGWTEASPAACSGHLPAEHVSMCLGLNARMVPVSCRHVRKYRWALKCSASWGYQAPNGSIPRNYSNCVFPIPCGKKKKQQNKPTHYLHCKDRRIKVHKEVEELSQCQGTCPRGKSRNIT